MSRMQLLAQLGKRGAAATLATMLLTNNLIGAQTTPVAVAMVAVAGIPLVWRGAGIRVAGALLVVMIGMLLYTLPAAVGRAGGLLEERESVRTVAHEAHSRLSDEAHALKVAAELECSPRMGGRGPNCRRLEAEWLAKSAALGEAERAVQNAPAPSGAAILAGYDASTAQWLGFVAYVAFAISSELGAALLFHMAVQPFPIPSKRRSEPSRREEDPKPARKESTTSSQEWIAAHVKANDAVHPGEAYAAYCAERKGRKLTPARFNAELTKQAAAAGKKSKIIAGRKMLAA